MPDLTKSLKDALSVTVGLGVLGFQRAQVRRRELTKQLEGPIGAYAGQIQRLVREVDGRVEPVLDQLESRLPESARGLVGQARSAARGAQGQLLARLPV
ncbi:MAG: hypothetical protein ACYDAD_08985 [Acidimicrobiales bacterium]